MTTQYTFYTFFEWIFSSDTDFDTKSKSKITFICSFKKKIISILLTFFENKKILKVRSNTNNQPVITWILL